jgi:uroporphyrinogen-III decarboxylase
VSDHFSFAIGDTETIHALMDCLVKAFESFADEMAEKTPEGLRYVDALMGAHNFYKATIFDLERRSEDKDGLYRKTAIDTLALALGIPITREETP